VTRSLECCAMSNSPPSYAYLGPLSYRFSSRIRNSRPRPPECRIGYRSWYTMQSAYRSPTNPPETPAKTHSHTARIILYHPLSCEHSHFIGGVYLSLSWQPTLNHFKNCVFRSLAWVAICMQISNAPANPCARESRVAPLVPFSISEW
jgi:hypothetical protein